MSDVRSPAIHPPLCPFFFVIFLPPGPPPISVVWTVRGDLFPFPPNAPSRHRGLIRDVMYDSTLLWTCHSQTFKSFLPQPPFLYFPPRTDFQLNTVFLLCPRDVKTYLRNKRELFSSALFEVFSLSEVLVHLSVKKKGGLFPEIFLLFSGGCPFPNSDVVTRLLPGPF